MKHTRLIALLLLAALVLSGCGNTLRATRVIGDSAVFSRREITSAMHKVARFFSLHFRGCTLLTITYEEDPENPPESDRSIRITTSFETGPHIEGSLSPNEIYTRYGWELERDFLGGWKLVNWGYG